MNRRDFVRSGSVGVLAAGALSACSAQNSAPKKLSMVTSWPAGFPGLGTSAERAARSIEAASGGRFVIDIYPAGELVGPFEVSDAVSSGKADLYHSADYYLVDKSPAYNFFTAIPFGMTATEMAGWILHSGGQALWDKLSASRGVKPLMCTSTGVQMGGWFNREINSTADFAGLNIRMPGLGGEALAKLGASPVNVAGGEIKAALRDGKLDAAEWVGPWNDLAAGMHEVASHYYYPGFHEPGGTLTLGVNLDLWNGLDETDQAIFHAATAAEYTRSLSEFNVRNASALKTLASEHGVVPKYFGDAVMADVARVVEETVASMAHKDPLTAEIHASFVAARRDAMSWSKISEEAFTQARRDSVGD